MGSGADEVTGSTVRAESGSTRHACARLTTLLKVLAVELPLGRHLFAHGARFTRHQGATGVNAGHRRVTGVRLRRLTATCRRRLPGGWRRPAVSRVRRRGRRLPVGRGRLTVTGRRWLSRGWWRTFRRAQWSLDEGSCPEIDGIHLVAETNHLPQTFFQVISTLSEHLCIVPDN